MVIDGSEAGGGLLRAAVPLSLSYQIPLEIVNFRTGRRELGLGWPHVAVLRALGCSGIITVDGASMGSTHFSVAPADNITPGGHVNVNLDDPEFTFLSSDIRTMRDYHIAEDAFPAQELINRDGRGVRGHAVSTPLLGLLPLTLSGVTLSLTGGTETPAAPFVDALKSSTIPVINSLFNLQMGIDIQSRGAFGLGGGHVCTTANTDYVSEVEEKPSFVTYWSGDMAGSKTHRSSVARQNNDIIRTMLPDVVLREEFYDDTCLSINQLLVLPQTAENFARDISLCAEEEVDYISGEALVARVTNELTHRDVISRFHIEQVLLIATILGKSGVWRTERITPHIRSVIKLIETVTDAKIKTDESAEYTEIKVA